MKKNIINVCLTLLVVVFMTSCSSDDEIFGTGLTGKWDLVEVQNGPAWSWYCGHGSGNRYPSGAVIIEFNGNGKIVFNYEDGRVETLDYFIPEDQEKYGSTLPVMNIGEVPFGYDIEGNSLKLHYYGFAFCDHIPATFVFKRIKY